MHNAMMGSFPFQMLYDTISDPISESSNLPQAQESEPLAEAPDGTLAEGVNEPNVDSDAPEQASAQISVSSSAFEILFERTVPGDLLPIARSFTLTHSNS